MNKSYPPVFVFGRTINALAILRSLGRKGIHSCMVDSDARELGFYSRYCRQKLIVHELRKEPLTVLDELIEAGKKWTQRPVLICTRDEYLLFISKYRAALADYFLFHVPDPEMVDCLVDKRKLAQFAVLHHIPHPKTYWAASFDQLAGQNPDLRYPVVLKPPASHVGQGQKKWMGQKLLIVENAAALRDLYKEFEDDQIEVMIQEQVLGPETDILAYYACFSNDSQPLGMMTLRKLRQYPIHYGYGCAEQSIWLPEVAELGRRVLQEMKFRGVGGVEFKRDAQTGEHKLIEIDGRTPMNVGVAIASKVDLPWLSYCDLIGEKIEVTDYFKTNVKWFFFEDDLAAFVDYHARGELSLFRWLASYRGKKAFATCSLMDPKPFWVSIRRFLQGVARSRANRIRRTLLRTGKIFSP